MRQSMTGFANVPGQLDRLSWVWEARSVNARGLDLRLRLPEGLESLEPPLRAALQAAFVRGSISVGLRLSADSAELPSLNLAALDRALDSLVAVGQAAEARGLALTPASPAQILALRGVLEQGRSQTLPEGLVAAIAAQTGTLCAELARSRQAEGQALVRVLDGQLDQIASLIEAAVQAARDRGPRQADSLRARVAQLLQTTDLADESRLNQELALIAVRSDITEEIDRLLTHVGTARDLLSKSAPCGRQLDFLMQEFNREANTLCSKSGDTDLTRIGLGLKVVIDQMREQVQNLE